MRSLDKFSIVIDSNEFYHGNTWDFPGFRITTQSLVKYGSDYSVKGQVGMIGVERKSYSDYVKCIGADWKRFQKQLIKLQRNKFHCVIVEGSLDDPISTHSLVVPEAVILRTAQITTLGVPVLFAGSRIKATLLCINFMQASIRRIQDGV